MSQMGCYFIPFSIRCGLNNVDVSLSLFFLSITKAINWHDANTCKGKVLVDQLLYVKCISFAMKQLLMKEIMSDHHFINIKWFNPILPGLLNTLQTQYFTPLLIRFFFILEA